MPNVVFRPRVTERVPSRTWFAELATAPGPQVIGVTGDNSYQALFGREWLLEWSVEDDHLRLYQESLTHPGEWERVTSPLPPVFDSPLPATARRVSFAFDQSARMIVALEDEGVVKVTRWDQSLGQYVQNVNFSGTDPCLAMDATWVGRIPDSDVLIFYLSPDRTKVLCRVQRELYGIEHEIWDYGVPVILDRALPVFLRYQLLLSGSDGEPLEKVLLSDPYPYLGTERASLSGVALDGAYKRVVIRYEESEPVGLSALALDGAYEASINSVEVPADQATLAATALSGTYEPVVIATEVTEGLQLAAEALAGSYTQVVFHYRAEEAPVVLGATALDGSYEPA